MCIFFSQLRVVVFFFKEKAEQKRLLGWRWTWGKVDICIQLGKVPGVSKEGTSFPLGSREQVLAGVGPAVDVLPYAWQAAEHTLPRLISGRKHQPAFSKRHWEQRGGLHESLSSALLPLLEHPNDVLNAFFWDLQGEGGKVRITTVQHGNVLESWDQSNLTEQPGVDKHKFMGT